MSNSDTSLLETVDRISREVVAPSAATVDRSAAFPAQAIEALGRQACSGCSPAASWAASG